MKTALITGGSGGIGKAVAEKFINEGYALYLHYNQNKRPIEELINKYPTAHIMPIQANLSTKEGAFRLIERIGLPLDVIVIASGTALYGLVQDVTEYELHSLMMLHLTSPFLIIQKLISKMIQRKKGSIIVISSIWGQTGAAMEVAYSMVKGGQLSFVKSLAKEVAPSGIRVNALAPGMIQTEMTAPFSEEEKAVLVEEIPLGRIGDPKEVADAAYFLAEDTSSYITGQILSINGGWYC
ncbi:SDR family oxidoreductase [Bacillus sp. FJAT-47783]|uniref:elongation factor P 5-aminopentanone reductase n=1 Tax=Bacillus sp. FJAT-47783 TaxID=2922712 RepID=UPI001FAB795D|nr:SDR family oxidoreductase [Bacillus sp. FJAT-47783]